MSVILFAPVIFHWDFVPRLVNNIFKNTFQFLPLHVYAFWYSSVFFSVVVIVKLGFEEDLDLRIVKDFFRILHFV